MKPTNLLIVFLIILFTVSVLQLLSDTVDPIAEYLGSALFILCLFDFLSLRKSVPLTIARSGLTSLALNRESTVHLAITNTRKLNLRLNIYDDIPESFRVTGFPVSLSIEPGNQSLISYQVVPGKRGDFASEFCEVRIAGMLGLLQKQLKLPVETNYKVLPDYMPVIEYAMLKTDMRTSMMGLHAVQKRGDGLDFLELRNYRQGDSLRQIDWKSTSRLNKTISREYQVEQDQSFIFLLDCSHRMNILDDSLSHFDHVLNAMLLTSYIALKQGDAVGFAAFGLDKVRWRKPAKGMHSFHNLLEDIYPVQPTTSAADYMQIAESLPRLYPKNATVILLTNLRDNDTSEIIKSIRYLNQRYQVILANICEKSVDKTLSSNPESFEQALTYLSAVQYSSARKETISFLRRQNIQLIDTLAENLAISLANEYFRFKGK